MANADRVMKILLALSADTSGGKQVKEELKGIREEAKKVEEASKKQGDEAKKAAEQSLQGLKRALGLGAVLGAAVAAPINRYADEVKALAAEHKRNTDELAKQVDAWLKLADSAQSYGDVVKLALNMAPALAQASAQFAEFQAKELDRWQKFSDVLAGMYLGFGKPNQAALDRAKADSAEQMRQRLIAGRTAIDSAERRASEVTQLRAGDAAEGIAKVSAKIDELAAKRDRLRQAFEAASSPGAGREQLLEAAELLKQEFEITAELEEQRGLRGELVKRQEQEGEAAERSGKKAYEEGVNARLKEQAALMDEIQGRRAVVQSDPFALTGQQRAALIPILQQEAAALRAAGKEWEALRVEQELATLNFTGEFQANLVGWINSMGTAADQAADLITGTLNGAIQQTASLITDAMFRTGDWEAAILSLGESFVQQLITMGLQLVVQHTLGEALKAKSTATATTQGAQIAAATSIATGGTAAVVGGIAAAAAIALIIGLLAAGAFHTGGVVGRDRGSRRGRTGGLGNRERLYILEDDEVVLTPEQAASTFIYGDADKFTGAQRRRLGSLADINNATPLPTSGGGLSLDIPPVSPEIDPYPTTADYGPLSPTGPSIEIVPERGAGQPTVQTQGADPRVQIGPGANLPFHFAGYVNGVPMQVNPITGEMIPILRAQPAGGIWASGGDVTMGAHTAMPTQPDLGDINWALAGGGRGSMAGVGVGSHVTGQGPASWAGITGTSHSLAYRQADELAMGPEGVHRGFGIQTPASTAVFADLMRNLRIPVGRTSAGVFAEPIRSGDAKRGGWSESSADTDKINIAIVDDRHQAERFLETVQGRKRIQRVTRSAR
jgi:hypothetical protein